MFFYSFDFASTSPVTSVSYMPIIISDKLKFPLSPPIILSSATWPKAAPLVFN